MMKRVVAILLLSAALLCGASPLSAQKADGSRTYDRRHYHYALSRQGDELLLSSCNMRISKKSEVHFVSTPDGSPSVEAVVQAESKGRLLGFQKFITLAPSTGYVVRYEVGNLRAHATTPLQLVVILYDDAREVVATHTHPIDTSGAGEFVFATHPLTRCAKVALHTTTSTKVEATVKNMVLAQTTLAGACGQMEPIVERKREPFRRRETIVANNLPLAKRADAALVVSLGLEWRNIQAERTVVFEWFGAEGESLERYECHIGRVRGVTAADDGVRVEWFRRWERLPEGIVSVRGDYLTDNHSAGCGSVVVENLFPIVEGATTLVISTPQPTCSPQQKKRAAKITALSVGVRHNRPF